METVSYLTINEETREIVDNQSRSDIENIKKDIENFQIENTEVFQTFEDRINSLELIANIPNYNFDINNYRQLSVAAKTGEAEKYVNIGDQVIVPWSPNNKLAAFYNLPFDVVAINFPVADSLGRTISNNIWLQSHYSLTSVPFSGISENNAFYVPEKIMTAGTYYFTAGVSIGSFIAEEKYNFTLTQDVPANGQLVFSRTSGSWTTTNNLSAWRVNSYNNGFESTPIETVSLENGQVGTNIGILTQSSEYSAVGMNDINRIRYGYNRYSLSTVRQWCNGLEENGAWWKALNPFERCPSSVKSLQGFMAGLPKDFINIINPVQVVTKLNSVSDGGIGDSEITIDKFFLPSFKQQNITISDANIEESILPYWIEHASTSDRVHYGYDNHTSTRTTWTRSPVVSSEFYQRYIYGSGNTSSGYSYNSYGTTPICVIY